MLIPHISEEILVPRGNTEENTAAINTDNGFDLPVVFTVSNGYSTVVNFKREDEEQEKINSFYNEKRDTAVSTIKNWPAYIGFGVGAAAIAGSFFVGFWLLILTFAGVGYGAFTLLTNKSKRKQIEMSCDESKKATSAAMRQLFAEFKQYQKELDEYDAYHDRILDEIHKV